MMAIETFFKGLLHFLLMKYEQWSLYFLPFSCLMDATFFFSLFFLLFFFSFLTDLIQFHFMAVLCGESCFSGNVMWNSGIWNSSREKRGPISA